MQPWMDFSQNRVGSLTWPGSTILKTWIGSENKQERHAHPMILIAEIFFRPFHEFVQIGHVVLSIAETEPKTIQIAFNIEREDSKLGQTTGTPGPYSSPGKPLMK